MLEIFIDAEETQVKFKIFQNPCYLFDLLDKTK